MRRRASRDVSVDGDEGLSRFPRLTLKTTQSEPSEYSDEGSLDAECPHRMDRDRQVFDVSQRQDSDVDSVFSQVSHEHLNALRVVASFTSITKQKSTGVDEVQN